MFAGKPLQRYYMCCMYDSTHIHFHTSRHQPSATYIILFASRHGSSPSISWASSCRVGSSFPRVSRTSWEHLPHGSVVRGGHAFPVGACCTVGSPFLAIEHLGHSSNSSTTYRIHRPLIEMIDRSSRSATGGAGVLSSRAARQRRRQDPFFEVSW